MGLCLYIYNFLGSYHFLLFWSYGQFSVLCFFLLITSSGFSLQTQLAFLTLISQLYEMYVMNPKVGLNQKETKCLAGIQTQATSKCKDECVCVQVLNSFLYSIGVRGNFCFSYKFLALWWGTFIILKMKVIYSKFLRYGFLTELCLYILLLAYRSS